MSTPVSLHTLIDHLCRDSVTATATATGGTANASATANDTATGTDRNSQRFICVHGIHRTESDPPNGHAIKRRRRRALSSNSTGSTERSTAAIDASVLTRYGLAKATLSAASTFQFDTHFDGVVVCGDASAGLIAVTLAAVRARVPVVFCSGHSDPIKAALSSLSELATLRQRRAQLSTTRLTTNESDEPKVAAQYRFTIFCDELTKPVVDDACAAKNGSGWKTLSNTVWSCKLSSHFGDGEVSVPGRSVGVDVRLRTYDHIHAVKVRVAVVSTTSDTAGPAAEASYEAARCHRQERGSVSADSEHNTSTSSHPQADNSSSVKIDAQDISFVFHTSGSTRQPKPVFVPGQSLVNNALAIASRMKLSASDVHLNLSPPSFDPWLCDLLACLLARASNVSCSNAVRRAPDDLATVLSLLKPTVVHGTPSCLVPTLQSGQAFSMLCKSQCRLLVLGGEAFPDFTTMFKRQNQKEQKDLQQLLRQTSLCLANIYGTTECSAWASMEVFAAHQLLDPTFYPGVGEALDSTSIQLLCHGSEKDCFELAIGGIDRVCLVGLAELRTGQAPVMRAAGDIVKKHEDGRVTFVGRTDNRLKRGGHVFNVETVERALYECLIGLGLYCQCAVVVRKRHADAEAIAGTSTATLSSFELTAVVDCPESHQPDVARALRSRLAPQLVPDEYVFHVFDNGLPRTGTGKVDRRAILSLVQGLKSDTPRDVPQTTRPPALFQRCMAEHGVALPADWTECSFFEAGGDSHLAVIVARQMASAVHQPFDRLLDDLVHSRRLQEIFLASELGSVVKGPKTIKTATVTAPAPAPAAAAGVTRSHDSAECLYRWTMHRPGLEPSSNTSAAVCLGELMQRIVAVRDRVGSGTDETKNTTTLGWSAEMEKCVDASPLLITLEPLKPCPEAAEVPLSHLSLEVLAIGSHSGLLTLIEAEFGATVWSTRLPDRIESSCCLSSDGSTLVVGCYDGCVYVVNVANGAVHWRLQTGRDVRSTPTVHVPTGLALVGSHDGHLHVFVPQHAACGALCIEVTTGNVHATPPTLTQGDYRTMRAWSATSFQDSGDLFPPSILAALYVCQRTDMVYVASLGGVVAALKLITTSFSAASAGSLSQLQPSMVQCVWKTHLGCPVFATPKLAGVSNSLLVSTANPAQAFVALDAATGERCWAMPGGAASFSSPCVVQPRNQSEHERCIVGCHDGHLRCLLCNQGNVLWDVEAGGLLSGTASVVHRVQGDRMVFAFASSTGRVLVGDADTGCLFETIEIMHSDDRDGKMHPSPIFSSPVLQANQTLDRLTVYVGTRGNQVVCRQVVLNTV